MPVATGAENSVTHTTGRENATFHSAGEEAVRGSSPPRIGNGRKRLRKIVLLIVAATALVGLVVGGIVWGNSGAVKVQTGKVMREDLASIVTASGEIEPPPAKLANVNANSYGKVTELYVKEGDAVKKGQLLMRTEAVQAEADVDAQAAALKTEQADVEGSQASVQSAGAALKAAQADLQTAQANLAHTKEDYDRGKELLEGNLIAQSDFDLRLNNYKVAQATADADQARVAQARAQLDQNTFNRDMAVAKVAQAKAQLVRFKDVAEKTIYVSPIDGIITSLPVHLGENVVPGIQNSAGSLLYQVSDLSVITAEVKVDETDIVNVKLSQPAEVTIDAIPNKTFKGKVTEIGEAAIGRTSGVTSGQTGATAEEAKDFKVVVTLEDPPPGMRPGLSTSAKITTATRKDAVTVPIQALTIRMKKELEEATKASKGKAQAATSPPNDASAAAKESKDKGKEEIQGVFVVRGGKAIFTPVETGIMGTSDVEVLSGVKPGEEIVTGSFSVLRTLKNQTQVKVDNSALKANQPAT